MIYLEVITILICTVCTALCILLYIEKKHNNENIKLMIQRNVDLGKQLDILRSEMQKLNSDLIQLVKENHLLNIEVQTLSSELDKLRVEIAKCQKNSEK